MLKEIKTKLSPPWCTYVSELKAIFEEDPDIKIIYNENNIVKIYVNNVDKATALTYLLKSYEDFGNVTLFIQVIPPNDTKSEINVHDTRLLFEIAFKGNPIFSFIKSVEGLFNFNVIYVVFKNKVVQFFNDNLNDVYGNTTILYEDIARDIFEENRKITNKNIFYCTDVVDNKLKKPLGEWP